METQETIDILIVEDHQMFIDGIKVHLQENQKINKIYEALNGNEALKIIKEQKIDLIITDIKMPEMTGIELTRIVKSEFPDIKIIVFTMYNDTEIVREIIESEAEGYILKNASTGELINAINKIADGGTYYSDEVVSIMKQDYIKENEPIQELSEREIEILKLICQEYTTSAIAEKLYISPLTVKTHRQNMFKKSNSKTIVGLIKYAIKFNMI